MIRSFLGLFLLSTICLSFNSYLHAQALTQEQKDEFAAQQRALQTALEMYYNHFNDYPQELSQLTTPVAYLRQNTLQGIHSNWEYIPGATGELIQVRNSRSEDYSFTLDPPFKRRIAALVKENDLQILLEMAEQQNNPYRRWELLNGCGKVFRDVDPGEQAKAIPLLRRFAADSSSLVRSVALSLLGKTRKRELIPLFLKALEDDSSDVRRRAILALGSTRDPAVLAKLMELLSDPDSSARSSAVVAIGWFEGEQALAALLTATHDPDPEIRGKAIEFCAKREDPRVLEALLAALEDEAQEVRVEAIVGLAGYRGQRTANALFERYDRESSTELRVRIFDSLRQIEAEEEIGRLEKKMTIETKLALVKEDQRQIAIALETFYIDHSGYLVPDEVFVPGSIYSKRYSMDPEVLELWNQIPSNKRRILFSNWERPPLTDSEQKVVEQMEKLLNNDGWNPLRNKYYDLELRRSYRLERLTTPANYLNTIPGDPFNHGFQGHYRYGTLSSLDREDAAYLDGYILLSNGPDGDIDITPDLVTLDQARRPLIYSSYPFDATPEPLLNLVYDPTNGMMSNGGIVRLPAYLSEK